MGGAKLIKYFVASFKSHFDVRNYAYVDLNFGPRLLQVWRQPTSVSRQSLSMALRFNAVPCSLGLKPEHNSGTSAGRRCCRLCVLILRRSSCRRRQHRSAQHLCFLFIFSKIRKPTRYFIKVINNSNDFTSSPTELSVLLILKLYSV